MDRIEEIEKRLEEGRLLCTDRSGNAFRRLDTWKVCVGICQYDDAARAYSGERKMK